VPEENTVLIAKRFPLIEELQNGRPTVVSGFAWTSPPNGEAASGVASHPLVRDEEAPGPNQPLH